jgi:hypothetical protein
MSDDTNSSRYSMVVWHDTTKGRVLLSCAGPDPAEKDRTVEVRAIKDGIYTMSPSRGYPVEVRYEDIPRESGEGMKRHFKIRGANGLPIFYANPFQHPKGYIAGKRAFMICGEVEFTVDLANSQRKVSYASDDGDVVLNAFGDNIDLQGTRRLVVAYVAPEGPSLCFDCCDVDGSERTSKSLELGRRLEPKMRIKVGHGRFIAAHYSQPRAGMHEIQLYPGTGVELFEELPLDGWQQAVRLSSYLIVVTEKAGEPNGFVYSVNFTPMPSYAQVVTSVSAIAE